MSKLLLQPYIEQLPAAVREPARVLIEHYIKQLGEPQVRRLNEKKLLQAVTKVFAMSPYAAEICHRNPILLIDLHESKALYRPYELIDFQDKFDALANEVSTPTQLINALSIIRQREMLRIIFRALMKWSPLEETVRELSLFAEYCVLTTLRLLHNWQSQEWRLVLADQSENLSLGVIAVGKLGGMELNFSSDIDLIFVYPQNAEIKGARGLVSYEYYFTRLAQRITQVLTATTHTGRLFRVDLRLRPFGSAGPLAISFPALETYYQQQGRDWERYAWIKARVLGIAQWSKPLQQIIKPFVYRKYIDFGVIEALRTIKQLMLQSAQGESLDQDLKRGDGGIREIEFICQAFQLIQGGQLPGLQTTQTLKALSNLQKEHLLSQEVVTDLVDAYYFLRHSEHVLQMIADRQTHTLPSDELNRQRLAFAFGFSDYAAYYQRLEQLRSRVKEHFKHVLARPSLDETQASNHLDRQLQALCLSRFETRHSRVLLRNLGFEDVEASIRLLVIFFSSKRIQLLHQLTKGQLTQLIPTLLRLIGKCVNPIETLSRILMLLEKIFRRSNYLALLLENPHVCKHLVKLCSRSLWIAEHISEHPPLLVELLNSVTLKGLASEGDMAAELGHALLTFADSDVETQLDALRYFKLRQVFRIAATDTADVLDLMQVSDRLTILAETILRKAQHIACLDRQFGDPQSESGFAIIAYGKLGGIELSYDSDLDLVFLHEEAAIDRKLIIRIAQRLIHILNTRTRTGLLYRVDTRLRPSGEAGLLVSHVDAFIDYQQDKAWAWEQQALVRARVITGPEDIIKKFKALRCAVLQRTRNIVQLRRDIREMRQRMIQKEDTKRPGFCDIKHCTGGIIDIEFMVQFLVLAWAAEKPSLVKYTDNIRILETIGKEKLVNWVDVEFLIDTYKKYRAYIHQRILQNEPLLAATQRFCSERAGVMRLWASLLGHDA